MRPTRDIQESIVYVGTHEVALEIVPGATHLFEEAGTLEQVARLARDWFVRHLSVMRTTDARVEGDVDRADRPGHFR